MNDHLTDTQIEGFRRTKLEGNELLQVTDHLAACGQCRERSIPNGVLSMKIAHLQGSIERHLTDEELISWVDAKEVEDPDFVEAHLEHCPPCRKELAELHTFRAKVTVEPKRPVSSFAWLALAAAAVILLLFFIPQQQQVQSPLPVISATPPAAVPVMIERASILDELFRPQGKLLGSTPPPSRALSPVGIVTASDRPMFRWEAVLGASSYVVAVYDNEFRKVAESAKLTTTEWQSTTALRRGARLTWQVTVSVGDEEKLLPAPPAREAVFQVMNAETADAIENARTVEHASNIEVGLLFARAGALEDAEAEFRKTPDGKEYLRSVQVLLGHQR